MTKTLLTAIAAAGLAVSLSALTTGCEREADASQQATAALEPAEAAAAKSEIAKVVFVGKRDACDCTRKRVDESFAALQAALEGRRGIPVERLRVDADEEAVARYRELSPFMVLPAVYLLEESGALVELLQGEVTAEQVRQALGG